MENASSQKPLVLPEIILFTVVEPTLIFFTFLQVGYYGYKKQKRRNHPGIKQTTILIVTHLLTRGKTPDKTPNFFGFLDLLNYMETHSSILAWKIPWTKEPGRLESPWGLKE